MLIAAEFREKVDQRIEELGVDRVYSADQTAVFFKTVCVRCGGKDMGCVMAMLLEDSRGTKYTPFVVTKSIPSKIPETRDENDRIRQGFGIYVWKEVLQLQEEGDVVMHTNRRGWWNLVLSVQFLWFDDVTRCATYLNVHFMKCSLPLSKKEVMFDAEDVYSVFREKWLAKFGALVAGGKLGKKRVELRDDIDIYRKHSKNDKQADYMRLTASN
ncbi:hypothetical protein BBJ28_00014973 [Nothophytophthora sp. Chile5]|nr:hypothetical protein BBJ28_00014973 [Nothophytophthora sp. Chile5]